jgi:hypothetical protein
LARGGSVMAISLKKTVGLVKSEDDVLCCVGGQT